MNTSHLQIAISVMLVATFIYMMPAKKSSELHVSVNFLNTFTITHSRDILASIMQKGYSLVNDEDDTSCVVVSKNFAHRVCFNKHDISFFTVNPKDSITKRDGRYFPTDKYSNKIIVSVEFMVNLLKKDLKQLGYRTSDVVYK